jgi:sortase A
MKSSAGSYIPPALAFPQLNKKTGPQPISSEVAVTIPKTLTLGEYLGTISIPAFMITIPFYQGTEDTELKKGVGHFVGSVLPGVQDNSVLAGHRDSVFSQLGKLKLGDLLIINGISGKFTYKVSKFRIVMANDRTVIVPTKTAVLTLSTCYPFHFFGSAPKRFIVTANLVSKADLAKKV